MSLPSCARDPGQSSSPKAFWPAKPSPPRARLRRRQLVAAEGLTTATTTVVEGSTLAESLIVGGETILAVEAGGAGEVEAATGPVGWIIGGVVLLAAGAALGVGYLLLKKKEKTSAAPQVGPKTLVEPVPETRRRRRRPCSFEPCEEPLPINWPLELPQLITRPLIRQTAGDLEWQGIERGVPQADLARQIRDNRAAGIPPPSECFPGVDDVNSVFDAHHAHPLYIGGEDAPYNLCALETDRHHRGHRQLDNQSEFLEEYIACGVCTPFLSQHPPGQTYTIVGEK
jgi:hypothetical protein